MLDQIQQAEEAIRDGDTRTGFAILRQVLAENPDSERGWWVMSGLVPKEQRANCLMQVLRINPDNTLARETLNKLVDASATGEPSHDTRLVGRYLTWPYAQRSKIFLTLLGNNQLITATSEKRHLNRVRSAIKEESFSPLLFKNRTQVPLVSIIRIRQTVNSLQVVYLANEQERTLRVDLEDQKMTEDVLAELLKKLGSDYAQTDKPAAVVSSIGISTILILAAVGLTAFFYWAAGQAAAGDIQTGGFISLLKAIGPNGIALFGGVLILAALGVSAWLLLKQPNLTEITRLNYPTTPEIQDTEF